MSNAELPRASAAAPVLDEQKQARRVADVVAGPPTILVFIRHFG